MHGSSAPADADEEAAARLFAQQRYGEALAKYLELAQRGSIGAQLMAGWMHEVGLGVGKDLGEARRWYGQAADANSPRAQFYLGRLCLTEGAYDEAMDWLRRAASQRFAPAIYRLGWMYSTGVGVAADADTAREYFTSAAQLGHLFAQRELARHMIRGREGLSGVVRGVFLFVSVLLGAVAVGWKEPHGDRVLR